MEITELTSFTEQEYAEMKYLMQVLDPVCQLTVRQLMDTTSNPTSRLFVLRNENQDIIGTYTLGLFSSPTGKKASIEDVVVHPDYQGQHLGQLLIENALSRLKEMAPIHVQLTSRPARVAANALYLKMGFNPKDTNVYIMDIKQN